MFFKRNTHDWLNIKQYTKQYINPVNTQTLQYMSNMLGMRRVTTKSAPIRKHNGSKCYTTPRIPLMTPDDILHMPGNMCLVCVRGCHPFDTPHG